MTKNDDGLAPSFPQDGDSEMPLLDDDDWVSRIVIFPLSLYLIGRKITHNYGQQYIFFTALARFLSLYVCTSSALRYLSPLNMCGTHHNIYKVLKLE